MFFSQLLIKIRWGGTTSTIWIYRSLLRTSGRPRRDRTSEANSTETVLAPDAHHQNHGQTPIPIIPEGDLGTEINYMWCASYGIMKENMQKKHKKHPFPAKWWTYTLHKSVQYIGKCSQFSEIRRKTSTYPISPKFIQYLGGINWSWNSPDPVKN